MCEIESKIDYWLNRASSSIFNQGLEWYSSTKEWTEDIANQYNIHQKQVAGILAALSPMKEWEYNKKLTVEFLECQNCGHLTNQIAKCRMIYNGYMNDSYITTVLSGRKTISFYDNICYPNASNLLTVDFRMWNFFKKDEWVHITNKRWDEMEKVFQDKSKSLNISIPQIQAILWLQTKNEHGRFSFKGN